MKNSEYLRWLLKRKRVIVVDDVREQLTAAADLIDELSVENNRLRAALEIAAHSLDYTG